MEQWEVISLILGKGEGGSDCLRYLHNQQIFFSQSFKALRTSYFTILT